MCGAPRPSPDMTSRELAPECEERAESQGETDEGDEHRSSGNVGGAKLNHRNRSTLLRFICPRCNVIVDEPTFAPGDKRRALCAKGHRVHESGSLSYGLMVGLISGICVWMITWYLPSWAPSLNSLAMLFRIASLGYWVVLIGRGFGFVIKTPPTRKLGLFSMGQGTLAIVSFSVTAWLFYLSFHKLSR